ncbi:MAG: DUF3098 domain-containing protein [Bacteroidetes bacterium]|nr:DUF3098 domain-containing protein [Bacteroidota bacterium]MDA1119739.1 DUF3098 domain-containing protein [Bacteroidota bacterium]
MGLKDNNTLPFRRKNYIIMIAGVLILILGYIIMSLDQEEYGFGFLGLTLGPIVVMAGFIIGLFAILYKPKQD